MNLLRRKKYLKENQKTGENALYITNRKLMAMI